MSTDEDEEDIKPEGGGEGPEPYPYGVICTVKFVKIYLFFVEISGR